MGSSTTKPQPVAVTSVRIEQDKLDAFRKVAEAERRSVSQQLRYLIDRAIEEHDAESAGAAA